MSLYKVMEFTPELFHYIYRCGYIRLICTISRTQNMHTRMLTHTHTHTLNIHTHTHNTHMHIHSLTHITHTHTHTNTLLPVLAASEIMATSFFPAMNKFLWKGQNITEIPQRSLENSSEKDKTILRSHRDPWKILLKRKKHPWDPTEILGKFLWKGQTLHWDLTKNSGKCLWKRQLCHWDPTKINWEFL